MVQAPPFTFWNVVYTAIGAAIFWGKWGRHRLRPYGLAWIIEQVIKNERWQSGIEFLVFIILGCVVGIGIVQPTSAMQALTAGFGWTGLFARQGK